MGQPENEKLFVTRLQYTVTSGHQMKVMDEHSVERGDSFKGVKTRADVLELAESRQTKNNLVCKIAEGAVLTRRTAVRIFAGLDKPHFAMFRTNPEGFIAETKDTMDSMNLKPIEQAKIKFARKLFNSIPTSRVRYHDVDSYENLLAVMETL